MRVLIDANVPLNVWLADRPMALESAAVMEAVGEGHIEGYMTSSLVLFVLIWLSRVHPPAIVKAHGIQLLELVRVVQQPKGVFLEGMNDLWKDPEDGFQYYAAKRYSQAIDAIITTNTKHFKNARGMAVLTPAEFVRKHLK
jgi:predicted nucleic acid-binding protein